MPSRRVAEGPNVSWRLSPRRSRLTPASAARELSPAIPISCAPPSAARAIGPGGANEIRLLGVFQAGPRKGGHHVIRCPSRSAFSDAVGVLARALRQVPSPPNRLLCCSAMCNPLMAPLMLRLRDRRTFPPAVPYGGFPAEGRVGAPVAPALVRALGLALEQEPVPLFRAVRLKSPASCPCRCPEVRSSIRAVSRISPSSM